MKYIIPIIFLFVSNITVKSQCYELLWAEEFDYTGYPEANIWTPEVGGDGWGNNESQYYTSNDNDNAYVENGELTITALQENVGSNNYTSARLITKNKFEVQYGKIEARMKLPFGQGIWPAFWMLGANFNEVGWPACGEIDIMEMIGGNGRENTVHGTVHWDNNGSHAQYGRSYTLSEGTFADTFHVFSIEWTPERITWFMDGIQYNEVDITPASLSEFNNEFFLILNVAVGGNWPGDPDPSTTFPQEMKVDYIRVYKKSEEIESLEIAGEGNVPTSGKDLTFSLPHSEDWHYEWVVPEDAELTSGQGTASIALNWGCTDDTIFCNVTGACKDYSFQKLISTNDIIYGPTFIDDNEQDITFAVGPMVNTSYSWSFPEDVTILTGQDNDTVIVNWGTTFNPVTVDVSNSCGEQTLSFETVKYGKYPYPDINQPHEIPGTIHAFHFDYGGEGVSYHDTSTGNEGGGPRNDTNVDTEYNDNGNPNVGWISNGEWLEYTIAVENTGWYDVTLRTATQNTSGGPFSILANDVVKLEGIKVPGTGGWGNFQDFEAGTISLAETDTLLRLQFNSGGFNLSALSFSPGTEPNSIITFPESNYKIYPIPADYALFIDGLTGNEILNVYSISGRLISKDQNKNAPNHTIEVSKLSPGVYILNITHTSKGEFYKRFIKN